MAQTRGRTFLAVSAVPDIIPVTEAGVRWWIFANTDGFADQCVVRRGRRVFIDRAALEEWLEDGRPQAAGGAG